MRFLDFSKVLQAMDFYCFSFFSGLGPGGFKKAGNVLWREACIPGSSHGGIALAQDHNPFYSGLAYDENDMVSLLGGSGGEINYYLITLFHELKSTALWLLSKYYYRLYLTE